MKFAIVGAGSISRLRRSAIERLDGVRLAGVHDVVRERAESLAGGAAVFDDLDALVESDAVDAVIVCTPPNTHEEIAARALARGKHVLVEKPMAHSLEACRRMVDAAREADRVLTVGLNHRYFPAIRALKSAVSEGRIGTLSHVRGYAGHVGLAEFKAGWMYDREVMGGGALLDNGIHMLDLVHHVLGPLRDVYGKATERIWELDGVEDNAYALFTGQSGAIGTLGASWSEWRGYHFMIEAYGTLGMARAYYAPMTFTLITQNRPGAKRRRTVNFYPGHIFWEKVRGWEYTAVQSFADELADFVALASGHPTDGPIADAEAGFRSIEIANAVYVSSKSGSAVTLRAEI